MAITIQTERELRKYLFESFLKEQNNAKKLVLLETPTPPQTESPSGEENILKDIPAVVLQRQEKIKNVQKKIIEMQKNKKGVGQTVKATWNQIAEMFDAMTSDTAIAFKKYPATLNVAYLSALQELKEFKLSNDRLVSSNDDLPLPNGANYDDVTLVNMMFNLDVDVGGDDDQTLPFEISKYIKPNDYEKLIQFNKTSLSKLYSDGNFIYLAIPIFINKDTIEKPPYVSDEQFEAMRLGELASKNVQMPSDSYQFKNAVFEFDIERNKLKNWRYLSFFNAIIEIRSNPIFNWSIETLSWEDSPAGKDFKKYEEDLAEWYKKKQQAFDKHGGRIHSLAYQGQHEDLKFLSQKPQKPELNSFQHLDKQYYEDVAINIEKGRNMLLFGRNRDEGINWTFVGMTQNFLSRIEKWRQNASTQHFMESFDNRCQILGNEFRDSYYSTSSEMYMKQLEEIRTQNMTASLELATGETISATDARTPLYDPNIFKKLESTEFELTHENIAAHLQEYLGVTYDEFEMQQFIQLLQLKRTQNTAFKNNLKYSSEYSLKPKYRNLTTAEINNLPPAEKVIIQQIYVNEMFDISKETYDNITGNPSDPNAAIIQSFYERTAWTAEVPETSSFRGYEKVDYGDYFQPWDTGKSALTVFFTPFSSKEDLEKYKGKGKTELAEETINPVGVQSALDLAQLGLIPVQLSANPYTMAAGFFTSMGLSFASWWNRGGYINFIENKVEEIETAIASSDLDITIVNGIINDLRKNNIKIDNIDSDDITDEQKILILQKLIKRMDFVETMEQMMWVFDMIGWIPGVITFSKSMLLRRIAKFQRQAQQAGDVVPQQIKTPTGRYVNKNNPEIVYDSIDDAKAAKVPEGDIEPEIALETANLNPHDFPNTTGGFIPRNIANFKKEVMGAVDTVIEKIYKTLIVPNRALSGEKIYTTAGDVKVTLQKDDIIELTPEQYKKFVELNGGPESELIDENLTNITGTSKYKFEGEGPTTIYLPKDLEISAELYTKFKQRIPQGGTPGEAELAFQQQFSSNITFDEFAEALGKINKEQSGMGENSSIYENLIEFHSAYEKIVNEKKLLMNGQPVNFQKFKELYCDFYGIQEELLPNNALVKKFATNINPAFLGQDESIEVFLLNYKKNPQNYNLSKKLVNEFERYVKLSGFNMKDTKVLGLVEWLKIRNLDELNEVYVWRLLKNNQNYELPLMEDYASTYEVIAKIPIQERFLSSIFGSKKFAQYTKIPEYDDAGVKIQSGFKMSQAEYDDLAKELVEMGKDIKDYVTYSAPKLKGGYNAYKKQMAIFVKSFNTSKMGEMDFMFANVLNLEFGNTKLFAAYNKEKLGQTISELHQIDNLMRTGMLNLDEKSITTIIAGLKDWMIDYEKFFNYMLLSRYAEAGENIELFAVYDDYFKTGGLGLKTESGRSSKFEALKKKFSELRKKLRKNSKSESDDPKTLSVGNNEENLAAQTIAFDNQTAINKGVLTFEEVDGARTFFSEINTNYPMVLARFKKGLDKWEETFKKFLEDLNKFADGQDVAAMEPLKKQQLKEFISQVENIYQRLQAANTEISRSNFFNPKVFNFNNNTFNFLHQALHLSRIQNGSFVAIRQWYENFNQLGKEGWESTARILLRLFDGPLPLINEASELIAQIWRAGKKAFFEGNTQGAAGMNKVILFLKLLRENGKKVEAVIKEFAEGTSKYGGLYTVGAKGNIGGKILTMIIIEPFLCFLNAGTVVITNLIVKHPLFALTMTQYLARAIVINDLRTAEDISKNLQFNKGYIYPYFLSNLARMKGNILLSGNSDLKEQFKSLCNSQLMPHFAQNLKLLNNLTQAKRKAELIQKAVVNKQQYNNSISNLTLDLDITTGKKKLATSPVNKLIKSDKLNEIFTQFQSRNVILKSNTSNQFKALLDKYPAIIVAVNRKNEIGQSNQIINVGSVTSKNEKKQTVTTPYIQKGKEDSAIIYLTSPGDNDKLNEFRALGLTDLYDKIYDKNTGRIYTNYQDSIKVYNGKINNKNNDSEQNSQYSFNESAYNALDRNEQAAFKKAFITAIKSQKDLNDSISRKMFKMDVWVKDDDNDKAYIQSDAGLLSEYELLSSKLRKTFYFYIEDKRSLESLPRGTVGPYWKRIVERNKNSSKIVNDKLFDKLAFLDLHNEIKNREEFKSITLKKLNYIIGLLKNYLENASKEGNADTNPFVNFKGNDIVPDSEILKLIIKQELPNVFSSIQSAKSNFVDKTSWLNQKKSAIFSWLNSKLYEKLGYENMREMEEKLGNNINDVTDAIVGVLAGFIKNYHKLYKHYLINLGIYDLFASATFSNFDRINHFIIFLEGVALIKHCRNVQLLLNEAAAVTGISNIQQDDEFKIQQVGPTKRTIVKDHQLDIFSMLTGGIHSVKYKAAQEDVQGKSQIDLTDVDVVVNPIFINMPDNISYLDIIAGNDEDPLDTLFDKNLRDLAFARDDAQADNTPYYVPVGPMSQSVSEIPSFDNLISQSKEVLEEVMTTLDAIINGDDEVLKRGDSKLSEPIKALDQQKKQKTGGGPSVMPENILRGKKIQKFNFKIEEPLKFLFEDINQAKEPSVIKKMINNDSQAQFKKRVIEKNKQMFKSYIKSLQKDTNLMGLNKNILKIDNSKQINSINIKDPEIENIENILNFRDSLNLDVNHKISDVINNPSLLNTMQESINITLNVLQKYNLNDDISKVIKIILNKYLKSLPVVISKLEKVKEGIQKGNLKLADDMDIKSEFDKMFEMGIVKYSYEKKNKVILKRKINEKIAKNSKINISSEDVNKFLDDNDKNSSSKTVIAFKLKRVLFIISKLLMPMIERINKATQGKQQIDFKSLLNDYVDKIANTYKNSVDTERQEGREYIEFLKKRLVLSGGVNTDKILDYSYIIGYQQNLKTKNIDKLIILSDLSNLKNDENDDIDFINNFIFDIPYIYQIDLSKIMTKDTKITFMPEAFDMETIKIQLVENVMDEDKINNSSEINSALSTQNFINFSVYKFKKDRIELIEMLKANNIFLENYTQNTIFSI